MKTISKVRSNAHSLLLLSLILSAATFAPAGQRTKSPTKLGGGGNTQEFIKPQLLHPDTDPTLRFPIAKLSGALLSNVSDGWLDISRTRVHYEVVQPSAKMKDSFDVAISEIRDIKFDGSYNLLRIVTPAKKQTFFYHPSENWGGVHSASTFWQASGEGAQGTMSIQRTLSNFDGTLAEVKAALAPPPPVVAQPVVTPPPKPEPSAPPAPPVIVLTSPSGASPDSAVTVDTSPLVVRGVTMDNTGIPIVSINQSPANLRPQSAQAAEFWSEPLPLQPGDNRVEIIASNSAHAVARVAFTVQYTPKAAPPNPRALGLKDIIALLQGGVSSTRIIGIIKDRGIKLKPTADDLNALRAQGATDDLIQAIQQAAPGAP
jgi:hypothetical protein